LKYRNGQLDQEKQEKLGRLSGWTWDPYSDQWQEGYKHLNIYVKREGNALVPAKYKNKEGFTLGRWVRRRRWDYSQGKLSAEKRSALEQLPGWTWDVLDDMWQEGFDHLREYAHHKGSALVPRKYVANDGYNLGNWVVKQRSDRRKGKLSLEQQNKLEELRDWAWDKKEVLWMECLAALREYAKREGNTFVPRTYFTKYGYNLGTWVTSRRRDFKLGKLSFEKQKLLEQIHGWVWDTVEDAWQEGLRHLQEYIKQEGTTVLPAKYITEDGYKLESWVVRQRAEYRRGKLPPERKKAFDQVPGWTWDTNESRWQKGFAHLRDYIKAKGDALVPATYKTENGFRLGQWVRVNRKAIQERRLCKERRKALEQLVEWTWGHHEAKWQEGFRYLRAYVEREGHAGLSRTYITKDGYKLGQWVGTQRAAYQRGKLSSERQLALEQLSGWTWDTNATQWIEAFTRLCEYVEKEGDSVVPQNHVTEDGYSLGTWVARQRRVYRQGKLFKDREKALEELPGWTWQLHIGPRLNDTRWHECFKFLQEYVKREGHSLVPGRYVTDKGYKLGVWVACQRQDYRKGKLSKDRELMLVQLPHWTWDPLETAWLEGFKHLQAYLECQRHTLVPVVYVTQDGYNLGRWVQQQRASYKREKLSSERQKALEQLPGWTWKVQKIRLRAKE